MLGIAEGAYEAALPYLFQRKQFGTLIGEFQGMQHQYAQAAVEIEAVRLMVYNAARRKMVCTSSGWLSVAGHHDATGSASDRDGPACRLRV